jgi:hypothetical protein
MEAEQPALFNMRQDPITVASEQSNARRLAWEVRWEYEIELLALAGDVNDEPPASMRPNPAVLMEISFAEFSIVTPQA